MFSFYEKILLEQVRRGNRRAFAKLYNEYIEKIYRFIYFRTYDQEKARELTSEVFIKIFDYLLKGKEIESFRAFLYQTARHLIIDFYRTKSADVSLDEAREIPVEKDINDLIDQKLEVEKIGRYLSALKPEHQEIVILRFFEGLPFKEIAKIVGESEENVRTIASRSVKKLKESLGAL